MFSGLNKFLKYILPKRLFYRALIIVAAPTILLQIIVTVVFYDSVWIKANKHITRSLVSQLKTIEEVYQNDKKNLDFFTDSYKNNFNFEIGISQEVFPNKSGERKFSPMDRSLRRELKAVFGNNNYWFNTSKFKNAVEIKIKVENNTNFGFQMTPAIIPPQALIRKLVLSPVRAETHIDNKPINPEKKPAVVLLLIAIAIKTQNKGSETFEI